MKLKSVGQFFLMVIASLILTGVFLSWIISGGNSAQNFTTGGGGVGGDGYDDYCDYENHNMVWVYYSPDLDEDGLPGYDSRNEGGYSFKVCTELPAQKYQCSVAYSGPFEAKETPTTKCKNLMTQQVLLEVANE